MGVCSSKGKLSAQARANDFRADEHFSSVVGITGVVEESPKLQRGNTAKIHELIDILHDEARQVEKAVQDMMGEKDMLCAIRLAQTYDKVCELQRQVDETVHTANTSQGHYLRAKKQDLVRLLAGLERDTLTLKHRTAQNGDAGLSNIEVLAGGKPPNRLPPLKHFTPTPAATVEHAHDPFSTPNPLGKSDTLAAPPPYSDALVLEDVYGDVERPLSKRKSTDMVLQYHPSERNVLDQAERLFKA